MISVTSMMSPRVKTAAASILSTLQRACHFLLVSAMIVLAGCSSSTGGGSLDEEFGPQLDIAGEHYAVVAIAYSEFQKYGYDINKYRIYLFARSDFSAPPDDEGYSVLFVNKNYPWPFQYTGSPGDPPNIEVDVDENLKVIESRVAA